MRKDLRKIAREIKEGKYSLDEAERKFWLNPSSKSKVKKYLRESAANLDEKTKSEIEDELEENLRAFREMEARKKPKPKKYVMVQDKRYQDITEEVVDCGG